jgi:hypothetical protein
VTGDRRFAEVRRRRVVARFRVRFLAMVAFLSLRDSAGLTLIGCPRCRRLRGVRFFTANFFLRAAIMRLVAAICFGVRRFLRDDFRLGGFTMNSVPIAFPPERWTIYGILNYELPIILNS